MTDEKGRPTTYWGGMSQDSAGPTPRTDALMSLDRTERTKALWDLCAELERENADLREKIMSPQMRCPQCDQLRLEIGDLRRQLESGMQTALEWGRDKAKMQLRIEELEAQLAEAQDTLKCLEGLTVLDLIREGGAQVKRANTTEAKYLALTQQHARLCDQVYEEDGETLKHVALQAKVARLREEVLRAQRYISVNGAYHSRTEMLASIKEALRDTEDKV